MEYNYLFFTQRYIKVYRIIINVTIHLQLNLDLLNKTKRMTNTDISLDVRRVAQISLFAIRDLTCLKKKKTMNKKEFNWL